MVVVSPFPLPFSWQKPMVGVSCALLTAVEFLPLASLSGTEIQGGSNSPVPASCECSSSAHGGAASPPGPAQSTGAAGFGLCVSLLPAARQRGCWRAVRRKGCYGRASRLDLHFIPRKAVVQIPAPYSGSWQGTSQVNTACAASSGTLQGKTVSLVDPRLEFKWFSGYAAGQLHDAPACASVSPPAELWNVL